MGIYWRCGERYAGKGRKKLRMMNEVRQVAVEACFEGIVLWVLGEKMIENC